MYRREGHSSGIVLLAFLIGIFAGSGLIMIGVNPLFFLGHGGVEGLTRQAHYLVEG